MKKEDKSSNNQNRHFRLSFLKGLLNLEFSDFGKKEIIEIICVIWILFLVTLVIKSFL